MNCFGYTVPCATNPAVLLPDAVPDHEVPLTAPDFAAYFANLRREQDDD